MTSHRDLYIYNFPLLLKRKQLFTDLQILHKFQNLHPKQLITQTKANILDLSDNVYNLYMWFRMTNSNF